MPSRVLATNMGVVTARLHGLTRPASGDVRTEGRDTIHGNHSHIPLTFDLRRNMLPRHAEFHINRRPREVLLADHWFAQRDVHGISSSSVLPSLAAEPDH
jgi:hypothetical protein